jgi:hypothetical protein
MSCVACQQVKSFLGTMMDVMSHGIKTGQVVDRDKMEARLRICDKCEWLNRAHLKCTICGCFLHLKAPLVAANCPKGKWK